MPSKEHEALVEKVARVICFENWQHGRPNAHRIAARG
ncbi:Uncharacterised protein [Brucella anthropi]|nr:Uncharacterised protein [Brucella anthropi]